jgi:hypothetical protein
VSQFLSLGDRMLRVTLTLFAAACAIELGWVSLQHARGVMSHFNDSTPLDNGLFLGAGATVAVAVLIIAFYAFRSFTSSTAPPALTLAIRIGLVILLVSMAAGLWMILRGTDDLPPDTVGAAGSIKLLHAVGMHALQFLPALAWVSSFGSFSERTRRNLVALAGGGYVLMVGLAAVLALLGTAVTAAGVLGTAAELVALICMIAAWGAGLLSLRHGYSPVRV